MKTIKYILVILALAWITTGCDTDDKNPPPKAVSTGTENGQDDTNENDAPEDGSENGQDETNQDDTSEDDPESNNEEIHLKPSATETKPANWYIRLVVEDPARAMKSSSSLLGALEVSGVVEDHTLKASTPFGGTYLSIVFVDPDGVEPGAYKTNFHAYQENVEDQWRFTVRTDDADAQILLTWRGLYVLTPYVDDQDRTRYKEYRSLTNPLNKQMKLVDTSTGEEMAVMIDGKVQTYTFTMGGNERKFKWVVQSEEVVLSPQTAKLSTLQAKALRKDAKVAQKKIKQKQAESFDLSRPPMLKQELRP